MVDKGVEPLGKPVHGLPGQEYLAEILVPAHKAKHIPQDGGDVLLEDVGGITVQHVLQFLEHLLLHLLQHVRKGPGMGIKGTAVYVGQVGQFPNGDGGQVLFQQQLGQGLAQAGLVRRTRRSVVVPSIAVPSL